MVSKVILEYGKNRFCLHISHKKCWLDKKRIYLQKNRICNERKSPFSGKKVLGYKKTGIIKAKKQKNRIYLRKKGNNKNRKKKDFFPPHWITIMAMRGIYLH
jgi:hypothetical protein